MYACMHVGVSAHGDQKRVPEPLELVIGNCLAWVLRTELQPFARAPVLFTTALAFEINLTVFLRLARTLVRYLFNGGYLWVHICM